jgi:dTDP-4-dehydrorhamnose 3,5-epimerase
MKALTTSIPDVLVIEPSVFVDERGFFYESFNERSFGEITGIRVPKFVQDNHSKSSKSVLRGLHYQIQHPQAKLVRVIAGEVFDVAVDLRKSSPTFGTWVGIILSAENKRQMWIPEGFAHGFLVTSESAEILYKTTDYRASQHERSILWKDPVIDIDWPIDKMPLLSKKDHAANLLAEAELFP